MMDVTAIRNSYLDQEPNGLRFAVSPGYHFTGAPAHSRAWKSHRCKESLEVFP